ncbi:MAG: hypothetical protein K9M54_02675 [Kiritimatiellales bacterium]|nr:hypothetical protein [Kiritimatiellales bacterium]MCF7864051.1 hypothetical protein [Kiritimatiellales bacterium]
MSINQFAGLRKIRRLVESYQRPVDKFDPSGSWSHQYDIYMIAHSNFVNLGTIRVSRKPSKNGARLELLTVRPTAEPNLQHFTQATLVCEGNLLASPRQWSVTTKIAASETAAPYFNSGMTKTSEFNNGQVCISADGKTMDKTIPLTEPYGCKFCMLDAVQRMPAEKGFVIPEFVFLDEYDQIRSGYRLEFRQNTSIQLKYETAMLSLFTMAGTGQIPASYWRDATGRLLFFVSGLEVYVLSEENGIPLGFYKEPDVFKQSAQLMKKEGE